MFAKRKRAYDHNGRIPLGKDRARILQKFQRVLGIRFSDVSLLNLALAHKSYANENKLVDINNERLELLGDSVLGLVITERLYRVRAKEQEGYLAKCKAHIVSEKTIFTIASALTIDKFVLIGKGEEMSGGRNKSTILCDALEAIIGAYYLDSGLSSASDFVLRIFDTEIAKVLSNTHVKDYKTILQEYVQRHFKSYPKYQITKRSGPEHKQTFWIKVTVRGHVYGPASGLNKKDAEQSVAKIAYLDFTNNAPNK